MPPLSDQDLSAKLDQMILHLERMDSRDRLRTWGGFFRGLISLIPIILLVWSAWYFYQHGAELMQQIAEESAKQAAKYTQQQSQDLLQRVQGMMPQR
jgi:hypothetical protein